MESSTITEGELSLIIGFILFIAPMIYLLRWRGGSERRPRRGQMMYRWNHDFQEAGMRIGPSYMHPSEFVKLGDVTVDEINHAIDLINEGVPVHRNMEPISSQVYFNEDGTTVVTDTYKDLDSPRHDMVSFERR